MDLPARPTTAFVLAAGLGTRLRPLTDTCPKPLIEVRRKPLLIHVFEQLAAAGVRRFIVNTHHLPDAFPRAFPGDHWAGLPIKWVFEPLRLETGGGLRNILHLLPDDSPIFLAAGDILSTTPLSSLAEAHRAANRPLATLLLRSSGPPANVEVARDGTIVDLRDQLAQKGARRLGYAAIAVIEPTLHLPFLKPAGPESIIEVWLRALRHGTAIRGYLNDSGTWDDIGTPESLAAAIAIPSDPPDDTAIHRSTLGIKATEAVTITEIPAGASDRRFYRLRWESESAIACRFTTRSRPEYATYGKLATALHRAGLPVPRVLGDFPAEGWLWLEDCGDNRLDEALPNLPPERILSLYADIRATILRLQQLPAETVRDLPLAGVFDDDYYTAEHTYFLTELAAPVLGQSVSIIRSEVSDDLLTLRVHLQNTGQPPVPVHRDLQASNIIITPDGFRWIDFQSMRLGHPAFDTASIVFDPHTRHPSSWIDAQITADAALRQCDPEQWRNLIRIAGTQRLIQALGAYGLHGLRHRKSEYRDRIPTALRILSENLPDFLRCGPLHKMVLNLLGTVV